MYVSKHISGLYVAEPGETRAAAGVERAYDGCTGRVRFQPLKAYQQVAASTPHGIKHKQMPPGAISRPIIQGLSDLHVS